MAAELLTCLRCPHVSVRSRLRKIFGPKGENVGEWKKLRDEELQNLYYSPNLIRMVTEGDEMSRACSTYKGIRNLYMFSVGKRKHLDL
jgi:hypothetical protein